MRVVICGSRSVTDYQELLRAVHDCGFHITEVISGGAIGVDQMGERWAEEKNLAIRRFRPDYAHYGRSAPIVRNSEMLDESEAIIAVHDGRSRGTAWMIRHAHRRCKPVFVRLVEPK